MAHPFTDQHRPTQSLTEEKVDSAAGRPGLVLVAIAVVSLAFCAASFATRHIDAGVGAASISLLAAGASLAYRSADLRRVRQVQRDWESAQHSVGH